MNFIKDNCYLYHVFTGKLVVIQGSVDTRPSILNQAHFMSKDHDRPKIDCSREPGEVYDGVMWLPERNDNRARAIFIIYEEAEIEILKEQMQVHEYRIKVMKGEK